MGKRHHSRRTKERVQIMRAQGKSYEEIRAACGVPKSTLSYWLRTVRPQFSRARQLAHLEKIRKVSAASKHAARVQREVDAQSVADVIAARLPYQDTNFKKALLAMLYWAEGTKFRGVSSLKFVNTDPRMMLFYVTLLRTCFSIDEARLRARVHIHYYHDPQKVLEFWSRLLDIPPNQFGKVYVKQRSATKKFRENFMGICFLSYGDMRILREVMALAESSFNRAVPRKLRDRISHA